MKKISYFVAGALFNLVLVLFLSSYGNKVSHKQFNHYIVKGFESRFLDAHYPIEKFRKYQVVFDGAPLIDGIEVYAGGFKDIRTHKVGKNASGWIVHGGYSADEPELPASFRHFYDPTEKVGERYLKDHLEYLEKNIPLSFNPRVDQIEWAIRHPDHEYNWNRGIEHVVLALTEADPGKRNENMGFAYRALGETLHLIADMGCPAHVRDDSHPAPFGQNGVAKYFGSPDPYEEIFEANIKLCSTFYKGKVDEDLKTYFSQAKRVEDIAHRLAVYTNENFFTNQTISGSEVIPRIHPAKTYRSPKLEDCTYDPLSFTFKKTISGHDVLMCKDLAFSYGIFKNRGYPYIDEECVQSQAKALIPQIVEAGAHVIRLFFPQIEIKVESFADGKVSGRVIHKTDDEYKTEIKYNGKLKVINALTYKDLATIDCTNGLFNSSINLSGADFDPEKDNLAVQLEFGSAYVVSQPFTGSIDPSEFSVVVRDANTQAVITDGADRCVLFKISFQVPSGTPNGFKVAYDLNDNWVDTLYRKPYDIQWSYTKPGRYKITGKLINTVGSIVAQTEFDLNVMENDFIDLIKPLKHLQADFSCNFSNCLYMDNGSVAGAYAFNFSSKSYSQIPASISWSGRTFTFYQKDTDFEHKIEGTLSATCWMLEELTAFRKSSTSEWTIHVTNVPVIGAPCPSGNTKRIDYRASHGAINIVATGKRFDAFNNKWINYTHADTTKTEFLFMFWND